MLMQNTMQMEQLNLKTNGEPTGLISLNQMAALKNFYLY